ncbi:MAG TPA: DNA recombination protein RmuC, partial [Chitinophagaceae bacterium]|nr:DNA recombination protein RmuC [Chitinophagaceae bacterium]
METTLLILCILVSALLVLVILFRPRPNNNLFALSTRLDTLFESLDRISAHLKADLKTAREENAAIAHANRAELNETLRHFRSELNETLRQITDGSRQATDAMNRTLEAKIAALMRSVEETNRTARETVSAGLKEFSAEQRLKGEQLAAVQKAGAESTVQHLEKITAAMETKLHLLNEQAKADQHHMRQSLETSFKGFRQTFTEGVESMNQTQRVQLEGLERRQQELVRMTGDKLDQMRTTVEEKLQQTLSERLGQSFELVSRQLESVQKGLGEMQTLAQDVGGLKRVLSNVKMRGGLGEVQLAMLLENILAPDQYEANVCTKEGSADIVEFAIKMPNREGERTHVWLPVDAKFPREAYEQLQSAYDTGDAAEVEVAQKALESVIRKMARDICEKYIDPPGTTDFAILFLPFEGIY